MANKGDKKKKKIGLLENLQNMMQNGQGRHALNFLK
jgi:hypothetical protein